MNSFNLAGYLLGLFLVIAIVVSNVDRKSIGEKSSSIRKKILWDNEDNDQSGERRNLKSCRIISRLI